MIVVIAPEPSPAELMAELEALRAENARLRGLLGLDDRAGELQATGWSPTLFGGHPQPPATTNAAVVCRAWQATD